MQIGFESNLRKSHVRLFTAVISNVSDVIDK